MAKRSTAGELTRSAPAEWPTVNSRIWVHVQMPDSFGGEEVRLPTRVEDSDAGRLVVAAPSFRGDLHVVSPGLPVTVSWAGPRGQSRQGFLLAEVVRRRVAAWDLAPSSEVVVEQRRRFARVAASGEVRVRAVAEDPLKDEDEPADEQVGGLLVDLSEGGALVSVATGSWLALDRLVRVLLDVEGSPVDQLAQVVRVHPALPGDPGRQEVVVGFVEPVVAADVLRRHVMQTQIRHRRGGER